MLQARKQFKNITVQMPTEPNQPTKKQNKKIKTTNQPFTPKKPSNIKLSGQDFGTRKVF